MRIYTGTVNERYIHKSGSPKSVKAQAAKILNRNGSTGTDRRYVTCREAGEPVETLLFERTSGDWLLSYARMITLHGDNLTKTNECNTIELQIGGRKMAKDALFQLRMDSKEKSDVEELYENIGTSFAEAVRIFARKSLSVGGFPFSVVLPAKSRKGKAEALAELDALMKEEPLKGTDADKIIEEVMNEKYGHFA